MDSRDQTRIFERLRELQRDGGLSTILEGPTADWYEVELFPAAADEHVASAEALMGKRLPAEYAAFLHFSNGANLYVNESGLHGVGIASSVLLPQLQLVQVVERRLPGGHTFVDQAHDHGEQQVQHLCQPAERVITVGITGHSCANP